MIRENISNETNRVLELFKQTFKEKVDFRNNYNFYIYEGELGFKVSAKEHEFSMSARYDFAELDIYIHIKYKKVESLKFSYEDGAEGYGNFEEGWHLTTHNIAFQYDLEEPEIIPNIEQFVVDTIDRFLIDVNNN